MRFKIKGFALRSGTAEVVFSARGVSDRLANAYDALHEAAAADMLPFMPRRTGGFRERTRAANAALIGSGQIYAGVGPMGRYLYQNRIMVDAATGKGPGFIPEVGPRFKKGARLTSTGRHLRYSDAGARAAWFEYAKARRLKRWIDETRSALNGGR